MSTKSKKLTVEQRLQRSAAAAAGEKGKFSYVTTEDGKLRFGTTRSLGGAPKIWQTDRDYVFVPLAGLAGSRRDVQLALREGGLTRLLDDLENFIISAENYKTDVDVFTHGTHTSPRRMRASEYFQSRTGRKAPAREKYDTTDEALEQLDRKLSENEARFNRILKEDKESKSTARGASGGRASGGRAPGFVAKYNEGQVLKVNEMKENGAGANVSKKVPDLKKPNVFVLPGLPRAYLSLMKAHEKEGDQRVIVQSRIRGMARAAAHAYAQMGMAAPADLEAQIHSAAERYMASLGGKKRAASTKAAAPAAAASSSRSSRSSRSSTRSRSGSREAKPVSRSPAARPRTPTPPRSASNARSAAGGAALKRAGRGRRGV